jgi:uncharacterized protein (TIGR02246 family)
MTTTDTALQRRLDQVGDVLTSRDAERTGDLYTRDGQLMPPGSDFVRGREAVVDFWHGVVESGVETIDIETVEVEDYGSAAVRVGLATLAGVDDETLDRVKFIEVWTREDDEWRIHHDIWNSNETTEQ